jgi:hypothetical protein
MPKNQESLNSELFALLQSRGYDPVLLDSSGKESPVPEEAEVFQFNFIKDDVDYGKVTVTIDGLRQLVVYYGEKVEKSPKVSGDDSESWHMLLKRLSKFAHNHQLSFDTRYLDKLKYDMAKRAHNKKLDEGYYPMGKKASYSDNIPECKIIIQHSRAIEEGEQRYRNVAKIFIENAQGERFLAPTTKPGIARVYARHIAEGGTPYDERGQHITSVCEEYSKMAGFVRATRGKQFNESAQRLVTEGINHYQGLRETLHKLAGKKGYNTYFESWTPPLMEDEESVDLSEMFRTGTVDPRIESVMPILGKLNKNLSECGSMAEVIALENWADSLMDGSTDEVDDYVDPEEADYGDEYQDMVGRAGEFVKGVDQRAAARKAYKEKEQGVAEELTMKHQRDHKTQQFPDTSNSLAKRSYQQTEVPNVTKSADGHPTVKYRADSTKKTVNSRVEPTITPTSVKRKDDDRPIPSFLQKGVEEGLDADQKAAGQLGPTEKVKNNNIGKLVGEADELASILRLIK